MLLILILILILILSMQQRGPRISSKVMISSNSAGACRARHRVCAGYGASNYPNSAILTLVILSVAKDL
jgi:hypothetical protein